MSDETQQKGKKGKPPGVNLTFVSGGLAVLYLKKNRDAGNTLEIPSLNLTLNGTTTKTNSTPPKTSKKEGSGSTESK